MTLLPNANHEGVTFTSLELCDAADIERFVRALALNEDGVSNLVFNGLVESIVLIASVSQVLSSIVPPGLSDAVLLRPHNGLPDVLLLNSLRQRAETLKEHLVHFPSILLIYAISISPYLKRIRRGLGRSIPILFLGGGVVT